MDVIIRRAARFHAMIQKGMIVGLGHWEILAIAVAILLIFGGKKIPELMKGVGSGMREFRKGVKGEDDEPSKEALNESNANDSPKN